VIVEGGSVDSTDSWLFLASQILNISDGYLRVLRDVIAECVKWVGQITVRSNCSIMEGCERYWCRYKIVILHFHIAELSMISRTSE